jgi:hypothetical protein
MFDQAALRCSELLVVVVLVAGKALSNLSRQFRLFFFTVQCDNSVRLGYSIVH